MTTRPEFTRKTKYAAAKRAGFPDDFRCECCGQPITKSDPAEYDHRVPAEMGGDNSLGNCQVLRRSCHKAKYPGDMRTIAKSRSVRAKEAGVDRPKQKPRWIVRPPTKQYPRGYLVHRETREVKPR